MKLPKTHHSSLSSNNLPPPASTHRSLFWPLRRQPLSLPFATPPVPQPLPPPPAPRRFLTCRDPHVVATPSPFGKQHSARPPSPVAPPATMASRSSRSTLRRSARGCSIPLRTELAAPHLPHDLQFFDGDIAFSSVCLDLV